MTMVTTAATTFTLLDPFEGISATAHSQLALGVASPTLWQTLNLEHRRMVGGLALHVARANPEDDPRRLVARFRAVLGALCESTAQGSEQLDVYFLASEAERKKWLGLRHALETPPLTGSRMIEETFLGLLEIPRLEAALLSKLRAIAELRGRR